MDKEQINAIIAILEYAKVMKDTDVNNLARTPAQMATDMKVHRFVLDVSMAYLKLCN